MGLETEHGFSVLDPQGNRLDQGEQLERLLRAARGQWSHIRGKSSHDLYLETGARFYVDCGQHPEWATPEVTNPWDAVRYLKAGHRVLETLVQRLERDPGIGEVVMSRCNVSYGPTQTTFGKHESYSFTGDFDAIPGQLIPFLVSRVIFGAGGFTASPGIEFTLSPRSHHIVKTVSGSSTEARGLFHTKQESLSQGQYQRVHILCGDSLCSDLGNWITTGTTALVIAAVEAGAYPGRDLRLHNPVATLHRFARDPTCRTAKAFLMDGSSMSALDIQRHYCRCVGAHAHAWSMPDWAGEVHARWEELLERLERAPESVTCTLDAPMKLAVFRNHVKRRSFNWDRLTDWNLALGILHQGMEHTGSESGPLIAEATSGQRGPLADRVKAMKSFLRRRHLSWDQLEAFLSLRAELQEIDTRWTQLGPKGIFRHIEASRPSALDHAVPGVDHIEDAAVHPPRDTRAAIRGAQVKELAAKKRGTFGCSWEYILDYERGRMLNMADDPFATTAQWEDTRESDELGRLLDMSIDDHVLHLHFQRLRRLHEARRRRGEEAETLTLPF